MLTVQPPPTPNLVSSVGGAVSGTAGQTLSFGGTTSNTGNAATPAFNDLFVFYQSDGATWHGYQYVYNNPSLGPGASAARSTTYSFASPGTYYYRLCADWNGNVAESNEGDNCSGLQTVTVAAPVPPPPTGLSHACNADGSQVTLSWNAAPGAANYYVRLYDNATGGYPGYTDFYTGTSITYPITAGRSYSWWVHSNNASGYSAAANAGFSCAGLADLTASTVSVSAAPSGSNSSFSAPATNIGNASSGAFPVLFQITGSGDALFNSGYISLTPNESYTVSASRYLTTGNYQVRACANYNTGWTAITPESNYGNNCGPWTSFSIAAPPPPTCSLTSDAATVPTTIRWNSSGATSCTGAGFSTGGATSGATGVSTPGGYSLSCTGAGGTCSRAVSLTDSTCPGPASLSISANPVRVRKGQTSTITWNASNVPGTGPSCTITGPGVNQSIAASAAPICAIPSGSATPTITTQSTYTINCGGATATAVVNVVPEFEEF